MKKPDMHGQAGFTLVEMLISLSIFAVITAFATANFNAGRQGDELRFASQLVASSIRRAQTAATAGQTALFCKGGSRPLLSCISGEDSECGVGGSCVREVPLGYGVHLSTDVGSERKVLFFADADGDRRWDAGEEIRSDNVSPGAFVSTTETCIGSNCTSSVLDIVFVPPKPTTYFNDGAVAGAVATITLSHRQTGTAKTVTVNRISGQVSVD